MGHLLSLLILFLNFENKEEYNLNIDLPLALVFSLVSCDEVKKSDEVSPTYFYSPGILLRIKFNVQG